jgi:hypothetical protein
LVFEWEVCGLTCNTVVARDISRSQQKGKGEAGGGKQMVRFVGGKREEVSHMSLRSRRRAIE